MYKVFFWQLKLVSTVSIFATKKTFKKLSKILFTGPKKLFCLQDFQTFLLPSFSLFSFLGHR